MVMMSDRTLTCRDCSQPFTFTSGEQEFYAEKGFTNEPTRCPDCRQAVKASRAGGGRSGDSYGSYGSPRGERTMHPATCDACGRSTEVPFVPTSGKPVYCSDCFRNQRDQRDSRGSSRW